VFGSMLCRPELGRGAALAFFIWKSELPPYNYFFWDSVLFFDLGLFNPVNVTLPDDRFEEMPAAAERKIEFWRASATEV